MKRNKGKVILINDEDEMDEHLSKFERGRDYNEHLIVPLYNIRNGDVLGYEVEFYDKNDELIRTIEFKFKK
jgi:hypothetical protein